MKSFSYGLILGSLAPAAGIYLLGGSSLACFIYGALLAILPTVWVTRFLCPRKVVMRTASHDMRVAALRMPRGSKHTLPNPSGSNDHAAVTTEGGDYDPADDSADIESALRNFGCSRKKARAIASQVPASGNFNSRLFAAMQLSRSIS